MAIGCRLNHMSDFLCEALPAAAFSLDVSVPTANRAKGLSTGNSEQAFTLILSKGYAPGGLHLNLCYLLVHSPRNAKLKNQLRGGIELSDGPTRPARVRRVRDSEKYTHLEITLTEGRNRQVRRMIEALGATVLKLVRVKIGSIPIGGLQIGKWRMLTDAEVRTLRKLPGRQ